MYIVSTKVGVYLNVFLCHRPVWYRIAQSHNWTRRLTQLFIYSREILTGVAVIFTLSISVAPNLYCTVPLAGRLRLPDL